MDTTKMRKKLAGPIKLKFSGTSNGPSFKMYKKFRQDTTDFTGHYRPKIHISGTAI